MVRRFQENLGKFPIVRLNGAAKERLKIALQLFDQPTIVGYIIDKNKKRIVLYGEPDEKMNPMPFDMDVDGALEFVWQWLKNVEFPKEPVSEGVRNARGWLVYCEEGGKINGYDEGAFVAIEPHWLSYEIEPEAGE